MVRLSQRILPNAQRLLAAVGLAVLVISLTPLVDWLGRAMAGSWGDPDGDLLIVLSGADIEDGVPGVNTYWRCFYAAHAYRNGHFRKMLISGGGDRTPIAAAMRDVVVGLGVPRDAIVLETGSRSTRENALFSASILRAMEGRKVLLTSDFHMRRAHRAFRQAGVETEPRPIPDVRKRAVSSAGRWGGFLDLVEECVKIAYYQWKGWI